MPNGNAITFPQCNPSSCWAKSANLIKTNVSRTTREINNVACHLLNGNGDLFIVVVGAAAWESLNAASISLPLKHVQCARKLVNLRNLSQTFGIGDWKPWSNATIHVRASTGHAPKKLPDLFHLSLLNAGVLVPRVGRHEAPRVGPDTRR
jgi:hypothetical protein